jgi:hypothetical protein
VQLEVKMELSRTKNLSFSLQKNRSSPEINAVKVPSYLILAAGAAAWGGKNPTARHLTSRPAAPGIGGIAPAADGEVAVVVVDRL